KDLPIEQEVLQSISSQSYNIEDIKDLWEIIEETVIASGQALGYDELSDIWDFNFSDEESFYPIPRRNRESPTYHIKDLINIRLKQIEHLLKLRIN
ncbi:19734_t:CDS:1, partial [Racocetra persica]